MQRIDENTYIDDTLVTCAEYQLFIDEMRAQGKYYQPDHWILYQFPAGQARVPVLGVRFNDAKVFCEWMTKYQAGEWIYRLLDFSEARAYPLSYPVQSPLGYWIVTSHGSADFVVANRSKTNLQAVDFEQDFPKTEELRHGLERDQMVLSYLEIILSRNLSSYFHSYLRDRVKDIEDAITAIHWGDPDPDDEDHIFSDYEYLSHILDDLYIFQERIAGRSPAFEGIRLIKERIK